MNIVEAYQKCLTNRVGLRISRKDMQKNNCYLSIDSDGRLRDAETKVIVDISGHSLSREDWLVTSVGMTLEHVMYTAKTYNKPIRRKSWPLGVMLLKDASVVVSLNDLFAGDWEIVGETP